jgi:hypothetical protein
MFAPQRCSVVLGRLGAGVLALAGAVGAAGGCARGTPAGPEPQQRCACDYVTDLDSPGHVEVRVCARPNDIDAVALSCASSSGVGAVTGCRCQATDTSCVDTPPCVLPKDGP